MRGLARAAVAAVLAAAPLGAQAPAPIITVMPPSTRSAAMADAGVALVGDAGSVFINPSGLATIKVLSLEAAYAPMPGDALLLQGAGAFRVRQFNLGGGVAFLQLPDTSAQRENLTWVASADYRVGLLALGASGRYVSVTDTTGQVSSAFTTDAGFTLAVFDIMALAVSVQGIGNERLSGLGVSLPTITRLGYMLNIVDPQETARLLGTIEWVWTEGEPTRFLIGVEGGAVVSGVGLVVRFGYGRPPLGPSGARWTVGGGVVLGRLGLDYAYQAENLFGQAVHSFGLRLTP
ncbi:MAG TPA: hypothetical protein VFV65_04780 [Gemmatimonadales bacterium]|nr:hypothetical protein [Gemmatimonadales bacterium]